MGVNETVPHGVNPGYYMETKVPVINALSVCYITISTIALLLRYCSRRISGVGFWWDDWFAFLALPFVIALCAVNWAMVPMGWGRHMVVVKNTPSTSFVVWYQYVYVEIILYVSSLFTFKCSALALYYRIFSVHRWMARCCVGLGTTVIVWAIVSNLLYIFRCHPVSEAWARKSEHCLMTQRNYHVMSSIPSIIFSFLTLVLPLHTIWRLQLRFVQKIGLTIIFVLASFDLAVAIIRLWVSTQYHSSDVSWANVDMFYAGVAEPTIGILSCSLSTYSPLVHAFRRKMGWEETEPPSSYQSSYGYRKKSATNNTTITDGFRPWIGGQIVTKIDDKNSRNATTDTGVESDSDMFHLVDMIKRKRRADKSYSSSVGGTRPILGSCS